MKKLIVSGVSVVVLLLGGLIMGFGGITHVEPGEVGILVKSWGTDRGMQKETLGIGTHWINPLMYDAIVYDTRIKQYSMDKVEAQTGDGQPISVDITFNVGLLNANVPELHSHIGPDYWNRVVLPMALSSIKNQTSMHLSDTVYTGPGRAAIQSSIDSDLKGLSEYGISASANLRDIRFENREFVATLERKASAAQAEEINRRNALAAEQEAVRVENEAKGLKLRSIQQAEANRETLRLEGEGNQLRDEASAKGRLALATAEAEGLRLKNEALKGSGAAWIASMEWAKYMGPNVKIYGVPTGAPGTNTFMFDEALRQNAVPAAVGAATTSH